MDNLHFNTFFFAVPLRLLYDDFTKMMGEQKNPGDSTDFITPYFYVNTDTDVTVGSLSHYLGIPPNTPIGDSSLNPEAGISSWWHRAYNLIWNEHFRDQNLQDAVYFDSSQPTDDLANYSLLRRGKRYDYFTSCLPTPQKGFAVETPLVGDASISGQAYISGIGVNTSGPVSDVISNTSVYDAASGGTTTYPNVRRVKVDSGSTGLNIRTTDSTGNVLDAYADFDAANSTATADLSTASGITIEALRESIALQSVFENDANGGTRYIEQNYHRFGAVSSDRSLQRPEYIGGSKTSVHYHPVAQTSAGKVGDFDASPQGNVAAFGTLAFDANAGHGFTYHSEEHCVILGLMCITADLTYHQGVHKKFLRRTRFDYYHPEFANLGDQEVYNVELFVQGTIDDAVDPTNPNAIFGYNRAYESYKSRPSMLSGYFTPSREDSNTSSPYYSDLSVWHLAQIFDSVPVLGSEWIESNTPFDRVVAVPGNPDQDPIPDFIFDGFFAVRAARCMPMYAIPATLDRF